MGSGAADTGDLYGGGLDHGRDTSSAVFRKSPKSPNGALESRAGWKGLCRKAMTLLYVLIAARLDLLLGVDYVRDAVCIGFIANEALSIVENAGLMGMPLPEAVRKGIDVLKSTSESGVSGYGKP